MSKTKQKMTEKDAVEQLNAIVPDVEADHVLADKILLQFIRDSGHGAVADAWEAADARGNFYYA